jgi:hypothetical protein
MEALPASTGPPTAIAHPRPVGRVTPCAPRLPPAGPGFCQMPPADPVVPTAFPQVHPPEPRYPDLPFSRHGSSRLIAVKREIAEVPFDPKLRAAWSTKPFICLRHPCARQRFGECAGPPALWSEPPPVAQRSVAASKSLGPRKPRHPPRANNRQSTILDA